MSSAASRQAVAPSLSPAALPAVTRPCGRNGVFSGPGPPAWCPGASARRRWPGPSPSRRSRVAIGPGRAGSCRWRTPWPPSPGWRTANASARSLVMCGKRSCRFSAVDAHDQGGRVDQLLGDEPRVRVDALAHRVAAHVLDTAGDDDVVGAERDAAGAGGHGGHGAGAHPVDGEAGHGLRQAGQQRGGAADGQALVADLGGRGDRDLVDALGRQLRVAAQQLPDAADHQVVGAGLGVHALRARLAERGADAVDEDDVTHRTGCSGSGGIGHCCAGHRDS